MNPGIRILPLPSANGLSEGGWAGRDQGNYWTLGWETILEGGEPQLANGMKMWKRNGNTTTLFSLKGLEIVHQEGRGQVKTMVMEHFNGILFH